MVDEIGPSAQWAARRIEAAVAEFFAVQDVTLGLPHVTARKLATDQLRQPNVIRLRGRLLVPADLAYPKIAAASREVGYTVFLRRDRESRLDMILAYPGVLPPAGKPRYWVHALLLGATILTTLYVGAGMADGRPPNDLWWPLFHLWQGWPFALSLLSILLAHELGHYFVSQRHGIPRSLPYFIPLPLPDFLGNVLGTLGAVIVMKAPVTNRRVMLDVGVAGPLIGLLVAIPVLVIGLSLSEVRSVPAGQIYMLEGNSLLYLLIKFLMFGRWLPGNGLDVFIHPVAFAGWAGLLVTSFNLVPAGQFDGGHIVYSILGERAQRLTWPIILILAILGLVVWQGWFVWAVLVFLMGQRHPGPLDSITPLDGRRKAVALLTLAVFVLTFTPVPLTFVLPEADGGWVMAGITALIALGTLSRLRWRRQEGAAVAPEDASHRN